MTEIKEIPGIGNPARLKQWFRESGRKYIVLDADDLIDALSWPDGVEQFMRFVSVYREYRSQRAVEVKVGGEMTYRAVSDVLEPEEIREAIAFLKQQLPA